MLHDLESQARGLAERLRQVGHPVQAAQLTRILATQRVERAVLLAVREICETLLTAVEAIDPVTQTMIEDLRLKLEQRLQPHIRR